MTDTKTLAANIYHAALDMDFVDYIDTREEEINRLETALAKLNPQSPDDNTLLKALELIYI